MSDQATFTQQTRRAQNDLARLQLGFATVVERVETQVLKVGELGIDRISGHCYRGDDVTPGGIMLLEAGIETGTCSAPTVYPEPGTFNYSQLIVLSTSTWGANIYYTLDGRPPDASVGTAYTNPFSITSTTTVRAIAIRQGWINSPITTAVFTRRAQTAVPTISPSSTTFTTSIEVTISGPDGADIYYTTDGSTPSADSTLYEGAIELTASATVKAIAIKDGEIPSPIASESYSEVEGTSTVYFGRNASATASEANILAMSSAEKTSASGNYSIEAGAGYGYLAFPAAWTSPTLLMVGPFPLALESRSPYSTAFGDLTCKVMTLNGTSYRVFRSFYELNGAVTVTAS